MVNDQVISIELDDEDECEVEWDDGMLEIEASKVVLRVIAVDDSGNVGEAAAVLEGKAENEEDEDDD